MDIEESIKKRILFLLREINKNSFRGILNDSILISIQETFCKMNKERLSSMDLETEVKKYFHVVLVQNCKRNPNLIYKLLSNYFDIYDNVNYLLKKRDTDELRQEFVSICFSILIQNYQTNSLKTSMIKKNYQSYIKSLDPMKKTRNKRTERKAPRKKAEMKSIKKDPIKRELPEERKVIQKKNKSEPIKQNRVVYEHYSVHRDYIGEMISSLNVEEQKKIMTCSSISKLLERKEILEKMEYGLRYYPMLRFMGFDFVSRQEKLKKFMNREHYMEDIRLLQKKFFQSVSSSQDIVLNEIFKLSKTDSTLFQMFQVFLGERKNEVSYSLLEKNIKDWIESFQKLDLLEYQFSGFFSKEELPRAKVILKCFKNEYPEVYEALHQKYGMGLQEYHLLSEKLEKTCKEGIRKIKDFISFERKGLIRIDETEFLIFDKKEKENFLSDLEELPAYEKQEKVETIISEENLKNMLSNLREEEKLWLKEYLETQIMPNLLSVKMNVSDSEFLKSTLFKLKSFSPSSYEVLKEFHGVNFHWWYPSERTKNYKKALEYLKFLLEKDTLRSQQEERRYLKNLLKSLTPTELLMIREKRQGIDTYSLSQKYSVPIEEVYLLFAQNISFFGTNAPAMIKEIISNSSCGVEYLETSTCMNYILDNLTYEEIYDWKKELSLSRNRKINQFLKKNVKTLQE